MCTTTVTRLFFQLLFISTISLGFCNESSTSGCSDIERQALLDLKHDLIDPSNRLASWVPNGDCCVWHGVICDNLTGHVSELHLRSLPYQDEVYYSIDDYIKAYDVYWTTLFGGEVSPSLINLKHLSLLDLSGNLFGGIQIPRFLGSVESLGYLNLSNAGFGGMIPHQLGNLSNLYSLDLSGNTEIYVENLHWLSGLTLLEFLDFSGVNLSRKSSFNWLKDINELPSLVELHLSGCRPIPPLEHVNFSSLSVLDLSNTFYGNYALFHSWFSRLTKLTSINLASNGFIGSVPDELQNMTSLKEIDLSSNQFNSSIPNWLYGFTHLEFLKLGGNNLGGKISNALGNLTSLISLDLSPNYALVLDGGIPVSFKYTCNLRSLNLGGIIMNQEINKILEILSVCASNALESLDLSYCQLSGHLIDLLGKFKSLVDLNLEGNAIYGSIPTSLTALTSLRSLNLGDNELNGTLPIGFGSLRKLRLLDITSNSLEADVSQVNFAIPSELSFLYAQGNRLNGTLPVSFSGLTKLCVVDFSHNSLEGKISEIHFANLTKLSVFLASGNRLMLRVNSNWIPPPQLEEIEMGSWHVGSEFPNWLHSLKNLNGLDLSDSGIFGSIPNWFWNFSSNLLNLNLSHNHIHGTIPNSIVLGDYGVSLVDLSWNNFQGSLPLASSGAELFDLSSNLFSGSTYNFLCDKMNESRRTYVLNLGENLLSGEIPDCWINWQQLNVIRLGNNKFSGKIPESIGTLGSLQSLRLRNNNLSGEIPFLYNCTGLLTLDLGGNEFAGSIPAWIGDKFSSLKILSLSANKFYGHIPDELCNLASLNILDLAHNSLFGAIPSCIDNFTAMAIRNDSAEGDIYLYGYVNSVLEEASLVTKGRADEYSTILNFVRFIDLSDNNLSGEIPKEITSLGELQSLNLSRNSFTGRIPEGIGAMGSLESLDLSLNQLSGEIPPSLSSLTFLGYLNLSYNNFSGEIPLGTQLQSFNSSSFIGNDDLCGSPLTKNCSVDGGTKDGEARDDNGSFLDVVWFYFYVGAALGFVVGFWIVIGPLAFNRRWRYAYCRFLDRIGANFV